MQPSRSDDGFRKGLYEGFGVKGYCLVLRRSWQALVCGFEGAVKPRSPRSGAPKAQVFTAPSNPQLSRRDRECLCWSRTPLVCSWSDLSASIQGEPRCAVRHSPHQLISGRVLPVAKLPHATVRGRGAPRWDGTILNRGLLQPCPTPVTHPTLDLIKLLVAVSIFGPWVLPGCEVHAALRTAPFGTTPVSR